MLLDLSFLDEVVVIILRILVAGDHLLLLLDLIVAEERHQAVGDLLIQIWVIVHLGLELRLRVLLDNVGQVVKLVHLRCDRQLRKIYIEL